MITKAQALQGWQRGLKVRRELKVKRIAQVNILRDKGLSTKEIAERLEVSTATVRRAVAVLN